MENNNQENQNQLIEKLMEQQKNNKESKEDAQISISMARVSWIKYRLYVLITFLLIVLCITEYLLPNRGKTIELKQTIIWKETQIHDFLIKKNQYEKDKDLISLIENNENNIISCVNYRTGCPEIPQDIKDNFGFARSYLQINNLQDNKMEINEKLLLANINEYLLKDKENKQELGNIINISFWKSENIKEQLYAIPIKLQAKFLNKDYLLSFIENVDKNVSEQKEYRVLYKIDEINYNIMEYDQEQLVDIQIKAFYSKE